MIAILLGSVAHAGTHGGDREELRELRHFLTEIVDVREHRLVVMDGVVEIGRDRLEICEGVVDVRPDHVQLLGRRGLLLERNEIWLGGRRIW